MEQKVLLEVHPLKDNHLTELIENSEVYGAAVIALIKDMALKLGNRYSFTYEDEFFTMHTAWHNPQP